MVTTKNTKNVLKPAFSKTDLIISSDIDYKFFFKGNNLHINGNIPTSGGQVMKYDGANIRWINNKITT